MSLLLDNHSDENENDGYFFNDKLHSYLQKIRKLELNNTHLQVEIN